ncbi:MAG: hypothetical protein KC731_16080 [Myxococcales bacterium]|nr:hypothetical protein [Myxococcales bacterium]
MTRQRPLLAAFLTLAACGGDPVDDTESVASEVISCDELACEPSEVCAELGGDRLGEVGCIQGKSCELGPMESCNGASNAIVSCTALADGDTALLFEYCGDQQCGPGDDGVLGCLDR